MDKTLYFEILKQLHDVCRNNPAPTLTCMDAYNEIINYLYLRHLSDNNGSTNDNDNNLEYYYINYCQDFHIENDNVNEIFNKTNKSGVKKEIFYEKLSFEFLPRILNQNENHNIGFVKIMGEKIIDLKVDIGRLTYLIHQEEGVSQLDGGKKAQKIINKIYSKDFLPLDDNNKFNLSLFPYDALGEGFEKFMKDGGSSGGNWGQYFTNPQVINYIIDKININKKHTIIDPFAGSGGFLLQAKHKFNLPSENIYGRDFDDKLFKFLRFNSQVAKLEKDNITKGDSFDYYDFISDNIGKFDRIIANPPFGISVDIVLANDDLKKFWGIMKTGNATIKDSMGLSIYMMYKLLKKNGIAGFVTDRGILNNGTEKKTWQKKLRKEIITNCNISEILLLPKGIFAYTNFDTAVIIMQKGSETKEIKFHEGYFESTDKGKGDKKMFIKENILTISFEQIVNKDWSLKYDDYITKKDDEYNGIVYKTLGEVCEYKYGTRITKSKNEIKNDFNNNKYPVYGGGGITFYTDNFNCNENTLIISRFGVSPNCVRIINSKFFLNDSGMYIKKYNINEKYLNLFLLINQTKIYKQYTSGQAQKNMETVKLFREFKIPILPVEHQERIVQFMDSIIGDNYVKLDKIVSKFKEYDLFKILINENYDGFAKIFEYYDDIISLEKLNDKFLNEYKQNTLIRCLKTVKSEYKTLGEVCELQQGDFITKKNIGTEYNVWGGGINPSHKYNKFNFENKIVLTRVGTGLKNDFKNSCVKFINEKFFLTDKAFCLINIKNVKEKYLYYFLNISQNKWKTLAGGQAQPVMKKSTLEKLNIPIPSLEDQEKVVKMIEDIEKEDSEYNKMLQSLKDMIKTIYSSIEVITDNNENITDNNENITENNENEDIIDNSDNVTDSDESETIKHTIITYKNKEYYLVNNVIYRIKNGKIYKRYGEYKDGKVVKDKKEIVIEV